MCWEKKGRRKGSRKKLCPPPDLGFVLMPLLMRHSGA